MPRSDRARSVVVLLPALNEAPSVGTVIDRIPHAELLRSGYDVQVWVVDGRSTDGTLDIARTKGAQVFVQHGPGKGRGVRQAVEHLLAAPGAEPRVFVMLDADGSYPPEGIPRIVEALESGGDVVLGSRFRGTIEDGAITALNAMGNRFLSAIARLLYGVPVSDLCTGMWGFAEDALRHMGLVANGFDLEADLFAASCERRATIREVPIDFSRRIGEPKLVPIRTGFQIAWRLLIRRLNRTERAAAVAAPPPGYLPEGAT